MKSVRIWQVGNWCVHIGQKYIESPFEAPSKDVEILNYAHLFVDALKAVPDSDVISQPSWELYRMSPEDFEERLRWATIIVLGDVETKCLMLHPDFFTRLKWGDKPIVFPDRFDQLKAWIEKGGHFHMNGGWLSFVGELGKGGWGRSRLKDVLPVKCLDHDDLIESTEGYPIRACQPEHPYIRGLNWKSIPPILGFNETLHRPEGKVILEVRNMDVWHPLLAVRNYGNGRVSAWMTSASPHWGINFMKWSSYTQFWTQVFAG